MIAGIAVIILIIVFFRKMENYSSDAAMMYMKSLSEMSNVTLFVNTKINGLMQDSKNAISALENVNNTYAKVKVSPMAKDTFEKFSKTYFPNGSLTIMQKESTAAYMQSLSQMSNENPQIKMLMKDSQNAISALENVNNTYAKLKDVIKSNASPMVHDMFEKFSNTYFPNGSLKI
jgi:hypothetical protein